jgi:hypothetical protein
MGNSASQRAKVVKETDADETIKAARKRCVAAVVARTRSTSPTRTCVHHYELLRVHSLRTFPNPVSRQRKLWHMYGKCYDFTPFLKLHPGGSDALETARGLPDGTALFESYHPVVPKITLVRTPVLLKPSQLFLVTPWAPWGGVTVRRHVAGPSGSGVFCCL